MRSYETRWMSPFGVLLLAALVAAGSASAVAQTVYPTKDGTLGDGVDGDFDGEADDADWYFNESTYEGSIALAIGSRADFEHRLVWEYNLSSVTRTPPVSATLTFTIRGAPVYPFPDTDVHIYSYPADLLETMDDFNSGPTELQGVVTIAPYQSATEFSIDVSDVVSQALTSGDDKVAFRFQVNPGAPADSYQAFIDALDSTPATKPYLVIADFVPGPGDGNADGTVDLADHDLFADCLSGPDVAAQAGCEAFQLDPDTDVDLFDFAEFQVLIPDQS